MTAPDLAEGLSRASALWPSGIEVLPDPERERLVDLIRPESVREAFAAARGAPSGPAGEAARRRLRLLVPPYLAEATRDLRREASREIGLSPEERARRLALASWASERSVRERAFAALVEDAARRLEFETERRTIFDRAAARAGAEDARALLDATAPTPPGAFLDRVERAAIAPLDEAVAREAAGRRRRSPWCSGDRPLAMEDLFLARLSDREELYPAAVVRAAVREVAQAVGGEATGADPEARGGPGGLLLACRALGFRLHAAVALRVGVPHGADPAFRYAWAELFARVAVRGRGLDRLVPSLDEEVRRDLAFEAALRPRRMWARSSGWPPWEPEQIRREERATGRPTPALCRIANSRAPVERTAPLRGTLLALQLEERLLSRFGFAFWESRGARAFLQEIGEGERGETAESVAAALGAGTMDPSPILDAYSP